MKTLSLLLLLTGLNLYSQSTTSITITTPENQNITVTYKELLRYKTHSLDSLQVLNHLLQYKSTLKNSKGILLKELLNKVPFGEESPKILSEYYITCIADDNYKVVFSWNELFNSTTGDHTLVVTEANGTIAPKRKEGIAILTPTDKATGRRYLKNLKTIRIERVK